MSRLEFDVAGRKQVAHPTWYRGEQTNFNPGVSNMRAPGAVEDYILSGWLPPAPFITPDSRITAFGSCFAEHISEYLNSRNYSILTKGETNAYVVQMGEGIVNSYAIRQQFDWAFLGKAPETELWHGYDAESYGYSEEVRLNTLALFEQTDVFILTFGLSEVWYDIPTGEVFWRAVPADKFDPERHAFRVTSVAENRDNIRAIHDLIREFVPAAKMVFTLSPIPLVATFRPVSCITANSVSKAVLRAALDEVHREVAVEQTLFYWPSYEIVETAFGPGKYAPDRRHIKEPVLRYIMSLFEKHYCVGASPPVAENRLLALDAAGELPPGALRAARRGRRPVARWANRRIAEDDAETAALVVSYAAELRPTDSGIARLLDRVRATAPAEADPPGIARLRNRLRRFMWRKGKIRILLDRARRS